MPYIGYQLSPFPEGCLAALRGAQLSGDVGSVLEQVAELREYDERGAGQTDPRPARSGSSAFFVL